LADRPIAFADLPNVDPDQLQPIDRSVLIGPDDPDHPPRILILYGSLRERSFSRLASEEAGRLLRWFGAETRTFNPSGLPLHGAVGPDHPKVRELRDVAA
jgi:arsenic resistance protein ArsH